MGGRVGRRHQRFPAGRFLVCSRGAKPRRAALHRLGEPDKFDGMDAVTILLGSYALIFGPILLAQGWLRRRTLKRIQPLVDRLGGCLLPGGGSSDPLLLWKQDGFHAMLSFHADCWKYFGRCAIFACASWPVPSSGAAPK